MADRGMLRMLLQLLQRLLLEAGILGEEDVSVCRSLFGKLDFRIECGGVCLIVVLII